MRGPIRLARRAPFAGIVVAAGLVAGSLLAATQLEVEFDRDDFVPEGSEVEATLAHQAELFGAGVTESTFVVVDGDLTDPTVLDALWEAEREVSGLEGVRTVGGTPQVLSVAALAAAMLEQPAEPASAHGDDAGSGDAPQSGPPGDVWTGDGFADDADLDALYDGLRQAVGETRMAQLLSADREAALVQIRTTAGDAGAESVRRGVEAAFAPVERAGATATVTSEPIIVSEMSDDLGAFQARAIGSTLVVVLVLLTGYYAFAHRRGVLGSSPWSRPSSAPRCCSARCGCSGSASTC
ncbi:MMPL family transporter [Egibacter rhizosphaerae]|nr:MMPL family transporter [Egibacter rhizosphaerae]